MPPLVFIHIPKTAGTTFHKILSHQFKPSEVAIHHDAEGPPPDTLIEQMSGPRPKVRAVMGHTSARFHERLPEVRYLTCLRDPVARLISHYHHVRLDPTHYLHEPLTRNCWGLADYVCCGLSGELTDGMTRMIAGIDDFHHGMVDEAVFERALKLLQERFVAIITSTYFDKGILATAASLGWSTPYYIRRKKGHYDKAADLTHEDIERIEALNTFDRRLYDWALANPIPSAAGDLSSAVTSFQKANARWGALAYAWREGRARILRR